MTSPTRVCELTELTPGKGREFVVAGRVLAVFHSDEGIFVTDGICPHAGGPLAQGMLRGCMVTCPWHGWQFDVSTGCHKINARIQVATFPATVRDNAVWVELPD